MKKNNRNEKEKNTFFLLENEFSMDNKHGSFQQLVFVGKLQY